MNFTTKITAVAVLATGTIWAAACGSSSSDAPGATVATTSTSTASGGGMGGAGTGGAATTTTTTSNGGAGGGMMNPPPPVLGAQIDRMGRPAINTVGSKTFDTQANRDAAEKAYNVEKDPTKWVTAFKANLAQDLAILDALDAADPNGCGNQLAIMPGNKNAGAYDGAAAILADDRLRLRTDGSGACGLYLAVEANALGVANPLCGGRTPTDDVIDESYSLLAGAFNFSKLPTQTGANGAFPVGDNVAVEAKTTAAFAAGFPFFAAAN